ncbi:hypothetical protein KAS33_04300, partial [bacterium]|nr:hypothetical protein [bacterium]
HAAQGTSSWTLDISTQALTDQTTYLIKTKAIDKAGNEEVWGNPGDSNAHIFVYDLIDPQSVITVPAHLDHLSELPTISGTASDAFGLSEVRLSILKTLGTKYWHGSGWDDGEVWNLVYSTTNYTTWTSTGVDWNDNGEYVIKSKAWDNAQPGGNEEASGSEGSANVHRFTFDDTPPVSVIGYPTGGTLNTLTEISGTASDAICEVAIVKVRIADITTSTTYYWTLATWVTNPDNWHNALGTDEWTFGNPNITDNTWDSGNTYLIQSKALDLDSPPNEEIPSSGVTFSFDNTPPQSQITTPAPAPNNHYFSLGSVDGTAEDLHNPIAGVEIFIFEQDTSKYFVEDNGFIDTDVSTLTASAVDGTYDTSIETWTYTNPALIDSGTGWQDGYTYLIKSWASDDVNNPETPGAGSLMVFDKTDPVSDINIPADDGQYDDTLIQFTGGSADTSPGIVDSVKLSLTIDDGSNYRWDGSTWVVSGGDIWLDANAIDGGFDESSEGWLYNFDGTKWLSGKWYILKSKSYDRAGNEQAVPPESRFMITLPCDHFHVSGIPSEITAGEWYSVTVEAKAQDDSRATGYLGTIKFFADVEASFKINGVICDTYTFTGAEEGLHQFNTPNEGVALKVEGTNKKVWVEDTGPSPVETGEQTNITIISNDPVKFQVLVPLENNDPGSGSGKSGPVMPKTAGDSFSVTINCVDEYWNITDSTPTVKITTNDSNGTVNPSVVALSSGTVTVDVTFKTANSTWTVTVSDNDYEDEYPDDTSSQVTVQPDIAQKLQVLLPVETAEPGTGPGGSGKSGPAQYVVAG